VSKESDEKIARNSRANPRSCIHRFPQSWSLHHVIREDPRHRIGCIAAANGGETRKCCRLLRYRVLSPKSPETSAESFQRRHGVGELPAPGFRRKVVTIRQRGAGNPVDQLDICECRRSGARSFDGYRYRVVSTESRSGEKVELMVRHDPNSRLGGVEA